MILRLFSIVSLCCVLATTGCCGPRSRVWTCDMGDCGPTKSCATCCGGGGIKGWLSGGGIGCKGCGEAYLGEWRSDPPACCDPCDQCGRWNGGGCASGTCDSGSCGGETCGRGCVGSMLGWLVGTRYNDCGCGSGGCDGGCGMGMDDYGMTSGRAIRPSNSGYRGPIMHENPLDQNWEQAPSPQPTPGKPVHKAQTPGGAKLSSRTVPGGTRVSQASSRSSTASRSRPASPVRQVGYESDRR